MWVVAAANRTVLTQFCKTSVLLLVAAGNGVIEHLPPINLALRIKYVWKRNSVGKILDNYNILAMDICYRAQDSVLLPRRGLESADQTSLSSFGYLCGRGVQ